VLSTQVLQEFYVNVTRKIPTPLQRSVARSIVRSYALWEIGAIGPEEILKASELEERVSLSFWDALIVTAAQKAGAVKILSEDLNPGQRIDGVQIENPFRRA
jgi:predicted nucleic acid-binding protein